MLYWNAVLRTYATHSHYWFRDIYEDAKFEVMWEHEANNILTESIPLAESTQDLAASRFLPYSLITTLTVITLVVWIMGVVVPLLNYVVALGVSYLLISGMNSHTNYLRMYAEVKAVEVVLKSKIHYDEIHAQEIEEIMEILDQDE